MHLKPARYNGAELDQLLLEVKIKKGIKWYIGNDKIAPNRNRISHFYSQLMMSKSVPFYKTIVTCAMTGV